MGYNARALRFLNVKQHPSITWIVTRRLNTTSLRPRCKLNRKNTIVDDCRQKVVASETLQQQLARIQDDEMFIFRSEFV